MATRITYESDGDESRRTHYLVSTEIGPEFRIDCDSKAHALGIKQIIDRAHADPGFRVNLISALAMLDIHDKIRSARTDIAECPHNSFAAGNADGRFEAYKRMALIESE